METARALARPLDFARAAIGFCDLSEWAPPDDEALAGLDAALAMLPNDADAERAHLLTRIAYLEARRSFEKAVVDARRAVQIARRTGDPAVLQDAISVFTLLLRTTTAGANHRRGRRIGVRACVTTPVTVLDELRLPHARRCDRPQRALAATSPAVSSWRSEFRP
jgi:hypothetical protein